MDTDGETRCNIGRILAGMSETEKKICLTFDDGPHPVWTDRILDVLERYDAKAVFFVVGTQAALHLHIIERMLKAGHTIGNRTWSHHPLLLPSRERLLREIEPVNELLAKQFDYRIRFFRPPWGILSRRAKDIIEKEMHQTVVLWDIDVYDYAWPFSQSLKRIMTFEKRNECVILCHDGMLFSPIRSRTHTVANIDRLLRTAPSSISFSAVPYS